jgi:acyl carrier protein
MTQVTRKGSAVPVETRLQQIESILLEFLREEVFDALVALDEHTDLLKAGFDSLALLRLMNYAEQHLGLRIPESQITEHRIRTVRNLAEWISTLETQQ